MHKPFPRYLHRLILLLKSQYRDIRMAFYWFRALQGYSGPHRLSWLSQKWPTLTYNCRNWVIIYWLSSEDPKRQLISWNSSNWDLKVILLLWSDEGHSGSTNCQNELRTAPFGLKSPKSCIKGLFCSFNIFQWLPHAIKYYKIILPSFGALWSDFDDNKISTRISTLSFLYLIGYGSHWGIYEEHQSSMIHNLSDSRPNEAVFSSFWQVVNLAWP